MRTKPILRPATRVAVVLTLFALGVMSLSPAGAESAQADTDHGLELVAEIPFAGGTHMETARISGRDYAFVSEVSTGVGILRVVDITTPRSPRVVAAIDCNGFQGNVQVGHDKKTLVIGIDSPSGGGCMPTGLMGFITVDISNPTRPRAIGFAEIERGSHSLAAHPTKPYVYNGDGFPEAPGEMQVWSIKDPAHPKLVTTLDTGVHSPHDLAFNRTGSMLATANAVNLHLIDTRDPEDPSIVHTTQCPGCLHTHEARFSPDGMRLIVNDEHPNNACPGGGLYFYDLTKEGSEYGLELTGTYTIGEVGANANGEAVSKCTPHIFDISADGTKLAATWHEGGIRYLDISRSSGVTVGAESIVPGGPLELGSYTSRQGFAFSTKFHVGPYIYVLDTNLGFQVFHAKAAGG